MANKTRSRRSRESEIAVAKHLAETIWPDAKANGASLPGSDVLNVPVDVEVKARRDFNPLAWVRQSRKRGTGGFVVMRPDGLGVESVGDWLVIKRLDDEIELRLQVPTVQFYQVPGGLPGAAPVPWDTTWIAPNTTWTYNDAPPAPLVIPDAG